MVVSAGVRRSATPPVERPFVVELAQLGLVMLVVLVVIFFFLNVVEGEDI
jgi:hypothetical protein